MSSIKLIVGLGNPGQQYEFTRHNIGAKWVAALAARFDIRFTTETKFHLKVNNQRTNEISIKEFSSKKSSYITFVVLIAHKFCHHNFSW